MTDAASPDWRALTPADALAETLRTLAAARALAHAQVDALFDREAATAEVVYLMVERDLAPGLH